MISPFISKSTQEVPEWLEEIAMSAVGTGYGPGGGQFQSRDRREVIFLSFYQCHTSFFGILSSLYEGITSECMKSSNI